MLNWFALPGITGMSAVGFSRLTAGSSLSRLELCWLELLNAIVLCDISLPGLSEVSVSATAISTVSC